MLVGIALLLLPGAAANMAPVLVARIPFLAHPLDNHLHVRGRRVFGANKTIRGLIAGVLASTLVVSLLAWGADLVAPFSLIDYSSIHPLILGPLVGLGALVGDALKSFAKRQADIPPGHSWPPFDQIDWIVGMFVAIAPFHVFPISIYLLALFIGGALHPLVNIAGYYLNLKRSLL